jgi:hypothetical protein
MHKSGAFTAAYVQSVVSDSDRLDAVQKVKMRDEVSALFRDELA